MHNKKYWVSFASIEKIGSTFIKCVYDYFNQDIERAWFAQREELLKIEYLQKKWIEDFLDARKTINPDDKLEELQDRNINVLTYTDEQYPYLLRHIPNAPMVLFYKGNLDVCNFSRAIAVVGSRNISIGAKDNIQRIFSGFKNSDLLIVSGGAAGADTCAHEAALECGLKTIAVLGSGLDKIYPAKNKKLFEKIIDGNGVVMSEYWHDFEPMSWRFPARNRIVAGMCYGALIAEAALKSGALITANLALEFGRELMCIPGAISNPNTAGIYKLLKQGAAIVTESKDIFDAMNWELIEQKQTKLPLFDNLTELEEKLIDIISKDCLTIDEIFNTLTKGEVTLSELMTILMTLEIKGLIKTDDSMRYTVSV